MWVGMAHAMMWQNLNSFAILTGPRYDLQGRHNLPPPQIPGISGSWVKSMYEGSIEVR